MSHIFISYSRKDIDFAQKIVTALAAENMDTWVDWKSIPKGEDWEQEIYRGIEEADAFLFLISPDSVASEMCNKEIAHAVKNGKRILPIFISKQDPGEVHKKFYTGEAREEISKRNYIFCRDGQDDFNKAIDETRNTIHTDYEWLKYHTELQLKALKWEQKKDNSRLLRGKELREAEQQLAEVSNQEDPQPTKIQREYILASQRNEVRIRRQITIGLGFGLAIVAVLAVFAWNQRNNALNSEATAQAEKDRAEEQANIALARQLAAQAQPLFEDGNSKQMTSVLLAIQSMRLFPANEAAQILQNNTLSHPIAYMIHNEYVNSVAFSPDGMYVVSGGCDKRKFINGPCTQGSARVWKSDTGKEIARMVHDDSVTSVAFRLDGKYVVSGSNDGTARVWEATTGKEISRVRHEFGVNFAAFSPNGKYVVSGGCDEFDADNNCTEGTAHVWEASTGQEIARMTYDDRVNSAAFSSDGKYVVSGSDDLTARVWEADTGNEISRMVHDDRVNSVAFSPDGKYVVSGSDDITARVWESSTGKEIARMIPWGSVRSVAFSPDGKYVVSGNYDNTARVWDATTGKEIARMTHDGFVSSVAFSPDGKYVASGSYEFSWCNDCFMDNTVRVWEAATGKEIVRISHNNWVLFVAFSPDGKYVVSGSKDNTAQVLLYHLEDMITNACSRVTRNLTRAEWTQYIGDALPYQAVCPNLPIEPEITITPTP